MSITWHKLLGKSSVNELEHETPAFDILWQLSWISGSGSTAIIVLGPGNIPVGLKLMHRSSDDDEDEGWVLFRMYSVPMKLGLSWGNMAWKGTMLWGHAWLVFSMCTVEKWGAFCKLEMSQHDHGLIKFYLGVSWEYKQPAGLTFETASDDDDSNPPFK